jgi:hypothetical protein
MQFFKSDRYGSGYGYCLSGYPTDMVADIVCYYPADTDYSSFFADYPTFSIRIIRFAYLKNSLSIRLVPKLPSLYIDYNPTYYIIIASYSFILASLFPPT